jgi:predicted aspartyl protease
MPASLASRLGLKADELIEVKLSDGSVRQRGLTGAKLEIDGVKRTVPIAIGPDGEEPVLGYTSLEILQFKVDSVTKILERTTVIEC